MDKRQVKVLNEIHKKDKYEYTSDPQRKVDIIHYLASSGYIYYVGDDFPQKHKYCCINEAGRAAIYEWHKERRRWFIPVLISIAALIISICAIISSSQSISVYIDNQSSTFSNANTATTSATTAEK